MADGTIIGGILARLMHYSTVIRFDQTRGSGGRGKRMHFDDGGSGFRLHRISPQEKVALQLYYCTTALYCCDDTTATTAMTATTAAAAATAATAATTTVLCQRSQVGRYRKVKQGKARQGKAR
jgi:hypothetical protein